MLYRSFIFETPNPCNTRIYGEDGELLYHVNTVHPKGRTITYVRNEHDDVVASLEWRELLSDKVTIGRNKPTTMASWMSKSPVPYKGVVKFKDDGGRRYSWKNNTPGFDLQLFAEDVSSKEPIAQFINATYDYREGIETLAELLMNERALEIKDTVMVSFLFLQKSKRIYDTAHTSRAATFGAPLSTLTIASGYS